MFKSTLPLLRCVASKKCQGELALIHAEGDAEISYGTLVCKKCKAEYPILAGVAILVPDVGPYLIHHVKGIAKAVPDAKIPKHFRKEFLQAKKEIANEYIEEDLESDRVNALYLMNHYLTLENCKENWWQGLQCDASPALQTLVRQYWDQGPFSVIAGWFTQNYPMVIELGCGVGGLCSKISAQTGFFLGLDSSFQSVLLARHFNLGTPYSGEIKIPEDLLNGPVSRNLHFSAPKKANADFIVGAIDFIPVQKEIWDASVSMNTIDMLQDPRLLPEAQKNLLKPGGLAIQCGPYIWADKVAKRLRSQLPKTANTSAKAVEHLYEKSGFKIEKSIDHVPWLFFKHVRQIELYSVHVFQAKRI